MRSSLPSNSSLQHLHRSNLLTSGLSTDLSVDHVTHGHFDPHAGSLDVVVVEMLEDGQPEGGEAHRSSVAVRHVKTPTVVRIVVLEEQDDLTQKKRLDDFNGLLDDKDRDT